MDFWLRFFAEAGIIFIWKPEEPDLIIRVTDENRQEICAALNA